MPSFYNTIAGTTYVVNYTITSIPIRACFDSLIEFTANVFLTDFSGTLTFQIIKHCKNQFQPTPIGAQWNFSRGIATTEADVFSFFTCDDDTCCNELCCAYRVEVIFTAIPNPPT